MTTVDRPSHDPPIPVRRSARQATRDYLALMRLPNVFTAMADVAMGFLLVHPRPTDLDLWALALLLAASSLLYIAGVVFNDVFDIEIDRIERPNRPLPSGRVSLRGASKFGWKALLLGVLSAAIAGLLVGHPRLGVVASLLAICILLYDARLKRTAFGPLGMGACRMLNVMLGMNAATLPLRPEHWLVAGGIGVYIIGITWFARTEAVRSNRLHLFSAVVVMMLGVAMLAWFPHVARDIIRPLQQQPQRWHLLIGLLGAMIAWRCLWAVVDPRPVRVQMAVKQGIFSLVILDAAVCYAVCGVSSAVMILLLLAPALWFGRWIEST
jgi:4-hydroxybenzoate polyprenyltransferase